MRCGFGQACVGGTCQINTQTDPNNCGTAGNACDGTQYCQAGACVCLPGLTLVGGACVNLTNDPTNCGSAGNTCGGATPVCNNGVCVAMCGNGGAGTLRNCDGSCVNLRTDPLNCGGCGNVCDTGQICDGGCQDYLPTTCTACPCAACGGGATCQTLGSTVVCVAG